MDAEWTIDGEAPGNPGISPTWCSSAKEVVGCSLGASRVWFTIGKGIINEVYYPRVDIPQIRDLGFIVADDLGFWVEVKRLESHDLKYAGPGIPAIEIVHKHARFKLKLRVVLDSQRDVLLVEVQLSGDKTLRPYVLLAPHLGDSGHNNKAEVVMYRGRKVLWAEQGPFGLALAAVDNAQQDALGLASAGYVGFSDGWQEFALKGRLQARYQRAGPGNVALIAALPRQTTLALGFSESKQSAATLAISALLRPFDEPWKIFCDDWSAWHKQCQKQSVSQRNIPASLRSQFFISAMVLRVHQDKKYPGAMVASLSVPWGNTHNDLGGYHLVWPRDLVESAGALVALGALDEARDILRYLIATQHADGHWYQNQWLGGKPFWQGVQLDEAAFPIILAARLASLDALEGINVTDMITRAVSFIVRSGPISQQDRWEEDSGINPFTLTICIAALVEGSAWLDNEEGSAFVLRLADYWNAHIEDWTTVFDTELAHRFTVAGYYVRSAPTEQHRTLFDILPIKNHEKDIGLMAQQQVSVDFLQMVRFGLRHADDPLIRDTVKVVDNLLRVETPNGPGWYRYNEDGYGEHEDGSPFDGVGKGRLWPLLTGERGHYELMARNDPVPYLEAMVSMSGVGGMIPEQVWDSHAIPDKNLYPGCPTGGAMPLVWAHAEYIKLLASRHLGHSFDRPEKTWQRYQGKPPVIKYAIWLPQDQLLEIKHGYVVFIALLQPSLIHWGIDDWKTPKDEETEETGIGLHVIELDSSSLKVGQRIDFTWRHRDSDEWSGENYCISVVPS
jgi:glucoamylase